LLTYPPLPHHSLLGSIDRLQAVSLFPFSLRHSRPVLHGSAIKRRHGHGFRTDNHWFCHQIDYLQSTLPIHVGPQTPLNGLGRASSIRNRALSKRWCTKYSSSLVAVG
jgi:hypothetical protein